MADLAGRILGMHGPQLARNLLGGPAPVDQLAAHKVMQPTPPDKLVAPSAALAARPVPRPGTLRAVGVRRQPIRATMPQFPPDRARRTAQKPADLPKARPATMLRQNHATFLAVEVLVSSVHRNILCPAGVRCCT